jgi:hypothetical protein
MDEPLAPAQGCQDHTPPSSVSEIARPAIRPRPPQSDATLVTVATRPLSSNRNIGIRTIVFCKTEDEFLADDSGKRDRLDPAPEFRSFAQLIFGPEGQRDLSKIDLSGKSVRRRAGIVRVLRYGFSMARAIGRAVGSSNGRCQPLSAIRARPHKSAMSA